MSDLYFGASSPNDQDHGPERCRCGRVAKFGSDWCDDCLRGANPTPAAVTPRLAELQARDLEDIAARHVEDWPAEDVERFRREAARLHHFSRAKGAA